MTLIGVSHLWTVYVLTKVCEPRKLDGFLSGTSAIQQGSVRIECSTNILLSHGGQHDSRVALWVGFTVRNLSAAFWTVRLQQRLDVMPPCSDRRWGLWPGKSRGPRPRGCHDVGRMDLLKIWTCTLEASKWFPPRCRNRHRDEKC